MAILVGRYHSGMCDRATNILRMRLGPAILLLVGLAASTTCVAEQSVNSRYGRAEEEARHVKLARELDATALKVMLAPMFKWQSRGPFGAGAAGHHWHGLLVEQIARQLTRQGGIQLVAVPAAQKLKLPVSGASSKLRDSTACVLPSCRASDQSFGAWSTTVILPTEAQAAASQRFIGRSP